MPNLSRRAMLAALALSPLMPRSVRAGNQGELRAHCGITMVKPVKELGALFEARTGIGAARRGGS